jgi:hypothetical protein
MVIFNRFQTLKTKKNCSHVVQIVCGPKLIIANVSPKNANIIINFLRDELKLDYYLEETQNIVLVRIDEETLSNPKISEIAKNY